MKSNYSGNWICCCLRNVEFRMSCLVYSSLSLFGCYKFKYIYKIIKTKHDRIGFFNIRTVSRKLRNMCTYKEESRGGH